jgi:hypothetical protein
MGNDSRKEKHDDVPWSLLITLMAVLLTFFIVMPVMGFLWVDLDNLRYALRSELKKVQTIRRELQEQQWSQSNNSGN